MLWKKWTGTPASRIAPNSEARFWEAKRLLHSDGGGPHFIPFILHIYTLQVQKEDCGREGGSLPDQEYYCIERCPSPYLQAEGWQRIILNSFHVSCNAYSDSYCLLCNHCVWLTVIGPLPAKEASLFLTTIPIGMASFYKYRQQSTKRAISLYRGIRLHLSLAFPTWALITVCAAPQRAHSTQPG